jgi:predicted TIM-barrel fold metal-dependent hydrolase
MSTGWIDVHHHLIPAPYAKAIDAAGYGSVAGVERPDWSPEISLDLMDRHGIDVAITSVSAPGVHLGDDRQARELARSCNETSAQLVVDHPGRFGAFACLPLPDLDGALEEASYALDVLGADGLVLLSSHSDGSYLGNPRFDELLAELDRREATVFIHPAIPTIASSIPVEIPVFAMEFTFDTTRAAFNLAYTGALERFPNITWILSHAGGTVPYLVSRFSLLWLREPDLAERAPAGGTEYLARMYYDTALSANPHALSSLAELVGWDHVLFGSDFPFAPELATAVSIMSLDADERFDDASRAQVMHQNARRLFPRLDSATP